MTAVRTQILWDFSLNNGRAATTGWHDRGNILSATESSFGSFIWVVGMFECDEVFFLTKNPISGVKRNYSRFSDIRI